jgi:hypothetical protein
VDISSQSGIRSPNCYLINANCIKKKFWIGDFWCWKKQKITGKIALKWILSNFFEDKNRVINRQSVGLKIIAPIIMIESDFDSS